MTEASRAVAIIGDIHGHLGKLTRLLRSARLIDSDLRWSGHDTVLWFTGDFCDRGPNGVGVVELVMRLQDEALAHGGKIGALLGNHEAVLLAAKRFGDQTANDFEGYSFERHVVDQWWKPERLCRVDERSGGLAQRIARHGIGGRSLTDAP